MEAGGGDLESKRYARAEHAASTGEMRQAHICTRLLVVAGMCLILPACQSTMAPLGPDPSTNAPLPPPFSREDAPDVSPGDRAMMRRGGVAAESSQDTHYGEPFQGPLEGRSPRGFWGGVADVVGFPFRATGWLIQTLF
jgi:hypothetical protein